MIVCDAMVSDVKTEQKALFVDSNEKLKCIESDFDAFVVGKVYTGLEILETDV